METTLRIDKDFQDILKDLLKESGLKTQKEYAHAMILYFKETGINPKVKNRSTADELAKLRNTFVSFTKQQEKDRLDPLIVKINDTFEFLLTFLKTEALTKSDVKTLLTSKSQEHTDNNQTNNSNDERYQNLITHVKGLFADFEKNFKGSFGGYSIDKAVFERYKSMFQQL